MPCAQHHGPTGLGMITMAHFTSRVFLKIHSERHGRARAHQARQRWSCPRMCWSIKQEAGTSRRVSVKKGQGVCKDTGTLGTVPRSQSWSNQYRITPDAGAKTGTVESCTASRSLWAENRQAPPPPVSFPSSPAGGDAGWEDVLGSSRGTGGRHSVSHPLP